MTLRSGFANEVVSDQNSETTNKTLLCKEMRCFALSNYKHSKTGKKRLIVWKTSECMVFPQQLKAGFESWLLIARKSNSSHIKELYSPLFNQGVKSFTPLFNLQIACYIQKFCFLLEKQTTLPIFLNWQCNRNRIFVIEEFYIRAHFSNETKKIDSAETSGIRYSRH